MAVVQSPTVRRRRLGAELRAIRETRRLKGEVVARALDWSPAKVSRYELARTAIREDEVARLLDYYEVAGEQRAQLLALATVAARRGWWEEDSEAIPADLQQTIGLEAEASSISIWHLGPVPGILQTEAYARHIIGNYDRVERIAPGMVERRVRVRMKRQEVLTREQPPELSVILDESVLRRRIGDRAVMREQLQRLAREAERPNVRLRVLPLDAEHEVLVESFEIFGFGRTDPHDPAGKILHDVVSSNTLLSQFYVEGENETYLHRVAFRHLFDEALDEDASRALIVDTGSMLWA